ncbi:MAG: tetratricopeptide repeat protein [Vicinamibacteria bacterium]|nr:tetratricopeptide repeat protein [Vicinamibacteria bacterium]
MQGAGEAGPAAVSVDDVRAQLRRILESDTFVASQRLCRFLRFIVERSLDREVDRLKEYVVAVEVFDRDETYDPNIDSIVRVEARRLRAKLKTYYEGSGSGDPVLIGLRPGSYVPTFRALTPASPGVHPSLAATEKGRHASVAVLPFVNMSPEPDQDYFCDGITEEIINALTTVEELDVVARTSAFQFKGKAMDVREVGARLGATIVVEGSVRKAGNQLRITAQAIDAIRGYHLWSETYRRELRDVFALQAEISSAIARTLSVRLPRRREPIEPPDIETYSAHLRALALTHKQDTASLALALDQFRALIRASPAYAAPYSGLAATLAALSVFGAVAGRAVEGEMRRSAEEAVRLDPDSADAWAVLGGISAHFDFDWKESERRLLHAISLQPADFATHSWLGMVTSRLGRFEEAEASLARALRLNPLVPAVYSRLAYLYYLQGDDGRARTELARAFAIEPVFADASFVSSLVHLRAGRAVDAIEVLSPGAEHEPRPLHLGVLAAASFRCGKRTKAERHVARLQRLSGERYVPPLAFAYAYVGMADFGRAFQFLEESVTDRVLLASTLGVDPIFEPLRDDPRFRALVARMNLPPRP